MSDDLVKRLRDDSGDWLTDLAADRIEELEAKVAKAVEFAEIVERCGHGALWDLARTTLAEIRGED